MTAAELGQSLLGAAVQLPPTKIQIAQRKLHLHSDLDLDSDSDSDSDLGLYLASRAAAAAVAVAFAFIIVIAVVVADVATNFCPNAAQNCLSKLAT